MTRVTDHNPRYTRELLRSPARSIPGLQPASGDQPITSQHTFGNIVTAVYSAILREIKTKGNDSRFVKADRGKFEIKN